MNYSRVIRKALLGHALKGAPRSLARDTLRGSRRAVQDKLFTRAQDAKKIAQLGAVGVGTAAAYSGAKMLGGNDKKRIRASLELAAPLVGMQPKKKPMGFVRKVTSAALAGGVVAGAPGAAGGVVGATIGHAISKIRRARAVKAAPKIGVVKPPTGITASRDTLELSATGLAKASGAALKHRSLRDYLQMRFAKGGPAAAKIAKGVGRSFAGQALGAAATLQHMSKRVTDTKPEAKTRAKDAGVAGVALVHGGRNIHTATRIHSLAKKANKMTPFVKGTRNIVGGVGAATAAFGAAKAHQAFRGKNTRDEVKASLELSRMPRVMAKPSVGQRIDSTKSRVAQAASTGAHLAGGAAAVGVGVKLLRRKYRAAGMLSSAAGSYLIHKEVKPMTMSHDDNVAARKAADDALCLGFDSTYKNDKLELSLLRTVGAGLAAGPTGVVAYRQHRSGLKNGMKKNSTGLKKLGHYAAASTFGGGLPGIAALALVRHGNKHGAYVPKHMKSEGS